MVRQACAGTAGGLLFGAALSSAPSIVEASAVQQLLKNDNGGQRAIASVRFHSSAVTGITERRDIRTSGNDANALSALTAFKVTADFSFFSGTTSTAYSFPASSAGSGYGADAALAVPTTAFTSPV